MILWTILWIVVGIIASFVIVVALQPSAFRVERSATMAAPAEAVFAQINDFHRWEGWSPWAKLDPTMRTTYSGAPAGVGAGYAWVGNKQVGEGRMTIVESRPNDLVKIKLEFLKPFAATNTAEFAVKPASNQTTVTWTMTGTKNFFLKAFGLFMSMDKMVGRDFEKGLAQLRAIVETPRMA